ncbi:MAG: division/cell wall cluster transcriptional repressor MraZ [Desulfobacterales bacterium]|nr:division/cell wall cluster transcriptional repressor MraZ [Desulfobacterales bacterium]
MFRGSSFHTHRRQGPDRRSRPGSGSSVRSEDADGLMVSRMDNCLLAYPFAEWHKLEERILQLAEKSDIMRRFRRMFIGGAFECLCDKQDRILIPPTLRQYAGLNKDIVLVGVLDHFEIWSGKTSRTKNLTLWKAI